jgi:hypothetical protein
MRSWCVAEVHKKHVLPLDCSTVDVGIIVEVESVLNSDWAENW